MTLTSTESIPWINKSELIPETLLYVAATLRDRLRMNPKQIMDFFENYLEISGARLKTTSVKVKLANARLHRTAPYDIKTEIGPLSEEEALSFRIIEERTGLMAEDIIALYGLRSREHKQYIASKMDQITWDRDALTVLGGLLVYCCQGDRKFAISHLFQWLGPHAENRVIDASQVISNLVKSKSSFRDYLEANLNETQHTKRRAEFEGLLSSKPETADWTIEKLSKEYELKGRIVWSTPEHMLLWAGLVRYCELSWKEAHQFLEMWFERRIPTTAEGRFVNVYSAMGVQKLSIEDVAPVKSPNTDAKKAEFSKILAHKGWAIDKVKQWAKD